MRQPSGTRITDTQRVFVPLFQLLGLLVFGVTFNVTLKMTRFDVLDMVSIAVTVIVFTARTAVTRSDSDVVASNVGASSARAAAGILYWSALK